MLSARMGWPLAGSCAPTLSNSATWPWRAIRATAPGKRPLSSMSPTIVTRQGKPVLVLSAGALLANPAWQGAVGATNIASRAIKREVTPEDLCGTLVYLASAESDFVTGQVIVVDGGSVMH